VARLALRPFEASDLDAAAASAAAAFDFDVSDPLVAARWRARVAHPLQTDPDGAFLA
jgi:hypothetical protein